MNLPTPEKLSAVVRTIQYEIKAIGGKINEGRHLSVRWNPDDMFADEIEEAFSYEVRAETFCTILEMAREVRPSAKWGSDFESFNQIGSLIEHQADLLSKQCMIILSPVILTTLQSRDEMTSLPYNIGGPRSAVPIVGTIGKHVIAVDWYASEHTPILILAPDWVEISANSGLVAGEMRINTADDLVDTFFPVSSTIEPRINPSKIRTIDVVFSISCDPDFRQTFNRPVEGDL